LTLTRPKGFGLACAWLAGCGGGAPLLHGAHALAERTVAVGAGFSGTFATGDARAAAVRAGAGAAPLGDPAAAARATAVLVTMAPAMAPWVSARFGLRGDNDVGLTYSGRALGIDARHAFEKDEFALSVGAGASWVAAAPSDQLGGATNVHIDWSSAGLDVPILVGWRSTAGIVSLWGGARGGVERVTGDALLSSSPDHASSANLELWRSYVGAVLGLGFGFRHIHGSIALDIAHQSLRGSLGAFDVRVQGITLAPAAGLIASF
jgi:hypothetical protein